MMMPYQKRFYWDGSRGCAILGGKMKNLTRAPRINGMPVWTLEYTPLGDHAIAEIQYLSVDCRREMTAAEIDQCEDLLRMEHEEFVR